MVVVVRCSLFVNKNLESGIWNFEIESLRKVSFIACKPKYAQLRDSTMVRDV
jgi:hypothetical protein